jgi:hypothetical protein
VSPPEGTPVEPAGAGDGEAEPRPRPWRLEPTLGPDGRLELIAFRDPDVPAQQARHALLTLVAAGAVLAFSLFIVGRLLWSSLVRCGCPGGLL